MAGRPRIGYLVPCFPGPTHPAFWREAQAIEALGTKVVLYSTQPPPAALQVHPWAPLARRRTEYLTGGSWSGLLTLPALPWSDLHRSEPGFARELVLSLGPARRLVESAARHGVHHVHVQSSGRVALIAALAERLGGPSYSLTLHGPLSGDGPGQSFKWRAARFATVVTHRLLAEVKTVLRQDRPARLVVQPLGIDAAQFRREAPYAPPEPGEPFRIFACGRLESARGFEDLLVALRRLLDQGIPATLRIGGADDLGGHGFRKTLERRSHELRVSHCLTLLGAVGEDQVLAELRAAHAFAHPGRHERSNLPLAEAMACSLPVVGTATAGARELVTHGVDGLLVPPRDPVALATALESLARNPERTLALSGAARARVEHDLDMRRGTCALMREIGLSPGLIEDDLSALTVRA